MDKLYKLRSLIRSHTSLSPPCALRLTPSPEPGSSTDKIAGKFVLLCSDDVWASGRRYSSSSHRPPDASSDSDSDVEPPQTDDESSPASPASDFHASMRRMPWFSYRRDFPPLAHGSTSDSGWGCMLRTSQMMLARAVLEHLGFAAFGGQPPTEEAQRAVTRLFVDAPQWPFSIHAMTEAGGELLGKSGNEWYGPASAAQVLCHLVQRERPAGLAAYVAEDGTVYRDGMAEAIARKGARDRGRPRMEQSWLPQAPQTATRPVLLLVPLRLGVENTVNPVYLPALAKLFRCRHCIGIVGGRPRMSLYFVGLQGDSGLHCLDPHFLQPYVPVSHPSSGSSSAQLDVSSWLAGSMDGCRRKVSLSEIDPSMTAGFYFANEQEWAEFEAAHCSLPPDEQLFSIGNHSPQLESPSADAAAAPCSPGPLRSPPLGSCLLTMSGLEMSGAVVAATSPEVIALDDAAFEKL